jgi:hypothetical protein
MKAEEKLMGMDLQRLGGDRRNRENLPKEAGFLPPRPHRLLLRSFSHWIMFITLLGWYVLFLPDL